MYSNDRATTRRTQPSRGRYLRDDEKTWIQSRLLSTRTEGLNVQLADVHPRVLVLEYLESTLARQGLLEP